MEADDEILSPAELMARPRRNWPARVTRLLEGSVIFVNPHDFTAYTFDCLDLLALLWDRIVVDSPREGLFSETSLRPGDGTSYPLDRFLSMVERGIFIPYDWNAAINDKRAGQAGAFWRRGQFHRIIDSGNYIIREDITTSTKFYKYLTPEADKDVSDPEFEKVVRANLPRLALNEKNLNLRPSTLSEVQHRFALHINWDGGLAQILGADIFIHPSTEPLWQYKVRNLAERRGFAGINMDLQHFIDRLRLDLPTKISVNEIEAFRKTDEAKNFRQWLSVTVLSAKEQTLMVPIDERVYLEFVRLCEAHRRRNEVASGHVTALASTGVGCQ